ncbi:hypothetical protein BJY01DRAFT_242376 [Aspergillus pseudoustus]|uniref:Frag1/DRAM/Sfk1 family-domain-containing protein n=1 Tax=Aspergillus pseudoustus TaxID=1810923 RepID=A0ABR4KYE5_9EURO
MAPRRGGGGGGYGGSSVSCSDSAFERQGSRIYIAFYALFFVTALVLSIIASSKAKRAKGTGRPLIAYGWLSTSIIFAMFSYIISIVVLVLNQCAISYSDDLYPAYIVSSWVSTLSFFILNAVILISFSKKLHTEYGQGPATILGVQKGYVALLLVLALASLALSTTDNVAIYDKGDYSLHYDLVEPQKGVVTTYYTLSVVGILIASGTIIKSVFGGSGFSRPKKLTSWVSALLVGALGFNVTLLADYVNIAFRSTTNMTRSEAESLEKSQQATYFLISFFYLLAFYAALEVGAYGASAVTANPAYTVPAAQHNPVYPQPHQDSRFSSGYNSGFTSNPQYPANSGWTSPGHDTSYQNHNVEYHGR